MGRESNLDNEGKQFNIQEEHKTPIKMVDGEDEVVVQSALKSK